MLPTALLLLFAATLVALAIFHARTLEVALAGLAVILTVRLAFSRFDLGAHLLHEWALLANLFGLIVGFSLLAHHFEVSGAPERLMRLLPRGARGAFALLVVVWALSGLLDNIASAMIGATLAARMFDRRVHLGYLAAVVAAANAGGVGSVIGDTTTTMMWIAGVSPLAVLPGYLGAATALLVSGVFAARQQARHAPDVARAAADPPIDGPRLGIVAFTLLAALGTNLGANLVLGPRADSFPFLAAAVWAVLLAGTRLRPLAWRLVPRAARGSLFLVALVMAASLMPVDALPRPSPATTLGLGFVSAIFDNIPLTKLALDQGGYDWALLAYAVGFGGSMVWFGSSAGVAVSGLFPEARSVVRWLRHGWHVSLAFVVGYAVMLLVRGFRP